MNKQIGLFDGDGSVQAAATPLFRPTAPSPASEAGEVTLGPITEVEGEGSQLQRRVGRWTVSWSSGWGNWSDEEWESFRAFVGAVEAGRMASWAVGYRGNQSCGSARVALPADMNLADAYLYARRRYDRAGVEVYAEERQPLDRPTYFDPFRILRLEETP